MVSILGAGVGYPIAGLLDEYGGVRASYGLGLFVAFLAGGAPIPTPDGRSARVDLAGADNRLIRDNRDARPLPLEAEDPACSSLARQPATP